MDQQEMFEQELRDHPVRSRIGWGIGFVVSMTFWVLLLGGCFYAMTGR